MMSLIIHHSPRFNLILVLSGISALLGLSGMTIADPTPEAGYRYLTEKAYLPPDFDEETFNNVWKVWPESLRGEAERSSPEQRRKMAFLRYGLTPRPDDSSGKPLQYVVDDAGNWTMNCFACHGGQVLGKVYRGLPNSNYGLQTLTEETRKTKLAMHKPLARMDVGSVFIPLGKSHGTTNAVMFGVALMAYRDAELNLQTRRLPPKMVHHDMDAPPWWHFKRKHHIYIDGFAEKGIRGLMQFMLVEQNGPEKFREWEDDFKNVYAYIESIEPPEYPFAINRQKAARGRDVFETSCARCHGTYGDNSDFPNVMVDIDEIGTDPVRLTALTPKHRASYAHSWFTDYGQDETLTDPNGYIAPPLDGIWASAPYFHNGSVPTLWHVLHPEKRPKVWSRSYSGYSEKRVGLEVEEFDAMPDVPPPESRNYFDSTEFGKSSSGHDFPIELTESERADVLEYLKTL
jgi:hypothetical protein